MRGQVCGVSRCKETGLTFWMWEVVESEKRHGSQATLSFLCECVRKPRWNRNREVPSYPAANLMPSAIDAILKRDGEA